MKKWLKAKGFTLVELLVVVSIISVLLSVAMVYTADAKKKGQDGLIVSETYQVRSALDLYAADHDGGYPNPDPKGTAGVWCVGGDYCTFYSNGVQTDVTNKLQGLPISDFSLPGVNVDGGGVNRGILYQQCVSAEAYCPSATDADSIDPNNSTSARIVFSTWRYGSSYSFAGTWRSPDATPYSLPPTSITGTIAYDNTSLTSGPVVATLTLNHAGTITNNGGSNTKSFTANGSFNFTFVDIYGNAGSATASVSNILTWSADAGSSNLDAALTKCGTYNTGGETGWHVPASNELYQGLADQYVYKKSFSNKFSSNIFYWSNLVVGNNALAMKGAVNINPMFPGTVSQLSMASTTNNRYKCVKQ